MRSNRIYHCLQHLPVQIISRHSKILLLYLKQQHHDGQFQTQFPPQNQHQCSWHQFMWPSHLQQKIATDSTPVTPTPELPANSDIPTPMTISYNESELSPPIPLMLNHHWPSTHRYTTRAHNGPLHLIDCVLKEHTVNMCMGPEIVESAIIPLWSLQHYTTHWPTTRCMYNVMNEETGEMHNYQKLLKQGRTREIWSLSMCKEMGKLSQG